MKNPGPIRILIHCRQNVSQSFRNTLKKSAILTVESIPHKVFSSMTRGVSTGVISIALVGPKEIQKLNLQYRRKNKPTDVLSFSRMEKGSIQLPTPETDLGDVLICWEIAKTQAREYGASLKEELARLTVHGVLHLFGYDHEISPKEEKRMFTLQDKILCKISGG